MDVAICGTINVEAYANIKYGEIYDKNLKLTFTGEGILNDQIIETKYATYGNVVEVPSIMK